MSDAKTIRKRKASAGLTDGLKPCPFCGGSAELVPLGNLAYKARCTNCMAEVSHMHIGLKYMGDDEKKAEAAAVWNRRAERTCRDFGGEEGTNGEGYDFACSLCGYCCDLPQPNFCPSCGARVEDGGDGDE